ncbi:MATE family efflux transporter [Heliorestis acidaminivorans]|uniref:Multidrug export protein MepA n=1 Tax=Heliorestis acidaminivorans TaxID=553427 RepID=A0A6I0EN36_9FIRM|nr:MATE family efflux transporter [Heliorestis acidaminivorans]KAB2950942.1 MATE family efflux transporter [Heliorestis acidaminivorans]
MLFNVIIGGLLLSDAIVKLQETPIRKLFFAYLIPSVLGMLLMSINIVLDGIFVSHGVGPHGLAGVNVAFPAFSIFFSISLWIGIGGATLYSIALGQKELQKARIVFSHAFALAISIIGLLLFASLWQIEKLAWFFGANEVILPYVVDYLSILLMFGIVYVLENILSLFVRNDGNPNLATGAIVITSLFNIFFNYLFILQFGWGVKGAAYATILSTFLGFLILLSHFFRKGSHLKLVPFNFSHSIGKDIFTIGFPSFVSEISLAIIMIGYNITFMKVLGEIGVAAYAIVNYIHFFILLLFIGIGIALQPIASFHYGAGLTERLQKSLRFALQTALLMGLLALSVGWFFADLLVSLFSVPTEELYSHTIHGISLFFLGYIFLGYNLIYAYFYQSTGKIRLSILITLSRGLVLVLLFLWLLPYFFGLNGIWLAFPIAEAITASIIFLLRLFNGSKEINKSSTS